MKKIFFFAATVVAMAACQKEAKLTSNEFTAPAEDGAPVAVLFSSNVKAAVETKAQGGVDAWDATQNLHIYGFQRQEGGIDYTTVTPFIDNVVATSPAEGAADNKLAVLDTDQKPFYYVGNNTYDFYGFYVDDLNVEPATTATGVYVPVVITGGEDVMVAKANPEVDGAALANPRYAYSAYAARRNVQPTLKFEHQLVRFRFQIESGTDFETVGDAEKNLFVTSLTINARNTADLYVAGETVGLQNISADRADLALCSLDATNNLVALTPYEVHDKDAVLAQDANKLGESLMVIPNESVEGKVDAEGNPLVDTFDATLTMTQFGKTQVLPLALKISDVKDAEGKYVAQTQFTAGYSYLITVKVYGLEEIEISAELEPWKDGGRIDIDTDVPPTVL